MDLMEEFRLAEGEFRGEVDARLNEIGREAVSVARASKAYKDVTGNLRRSNSYEVVDGTLRLSNTADYASFVEARTGDVLASAISYVITALRE